MPTIAPDKLTRARREHRCEQLALFFEIKKGAA